MRIVALEKEMSKAGFWDDQERGEAAGRELAELKDDIESWSKLHEDHQELHALNELAVGEGDEPLSAEVGQSLVSLTRSVDNLELRSWFTDQLDSHDAIVTVRPGAGGLESQDWAEMLLRMYLRYCEDKGFKTELNAVMPAEEAGIKEATFTAGGRNAYGFLKAEKGVHRLVRISPFDFQKRRHTSFASVDVIPAIDEDIEVEIDEKDLRIETYRSSGAGGQHVNVTDSAVRITHMPSRLVVQCQNERSQFQNKASAMKILRARLYVREQEERRREMEGIRGEKMTTGFGSQIRSYVLHPYQMAKDHRTDFEKGNVQGVLDGDLDPFIVAFHRWRVHQEETGAAAGQGEGR